jgi:ribosome-binding factor A
MPTTKPDDRRRPERVASRVKEEISSALRRDLNDPRLANVVLSRVHVTDDLSLARIAVSVLGDDEKSTKARAAAKVLGTLEGGLRKRIASRLAMRRVPSLRFVIDADREEASRLDSLLDEVGRELKGRPGDKE